VHIVRFPQQTCLSLHSISQGLHHKQAQQF
jgi:hypothetical protein